MDKIEGMDQCWDARLVPLNKVFPEIPTRTQLRPISIQSPVIKVLEFRFAPKLYSYLDKNLHRSQIGFVKPLSIQVNLTRAIQRIKLRTKEKRQYMGFLLTFRKLTIVFHTPYYSRSFEKNKFWIMTSSYF